MNKDLSRKEILEKELIHYCPVKNGFNRPLENYTVRLEDLIPALSGSVGKIALTAAFAIAWTKGLNIVDPTFVAENVRLEIVIGSLLTIIFSAILNPYSAPPGTLAPLIPVIPLMCSAGVHPLVLGLLIGIFGVFISIFKYFDKVVEINGTAARGGVILLFGIMGVTSSIGSLTAWTSGKSSSIFFILILLGTVVYIALNYFGYKWLMIPAAALIALGVSAVFKFFPEMKTIAAFPIINPYEWWFNRWGLGFGINISNIIKALPFALLAVVMWPADALAIKGLQESNYPADAKNSLFEMNSTITVVSIRNIIGSFLGGAQTAAIWRSFMIPLSIVKRPIGGSALLLGILGIAFGLLGFPLDIALFPPLIWMVLIFGVYMPLVEIGLSTVKTPAQAQIAGLTLLVGLAVNPVLGWAVAILIENLNITREEKFKIDFASEKIKTTIAVAVVTIVSYAMSFMF